MAKEYRTCVVRTFSGKKITIPGAESVVLAVRGVDLRQVQASVDITVPNLNEIKKMIRRE